MLAAGMNGGATLAVSGRLATITWWTTERLPGGFRRPAPLSSVRLVGTSKSGFAVPLAGIGYSSCIDQIAGVDLPALDELRRRRRSVSCLRAPLLAHGMVSRPCRSAGGR
jgi:hypothetical protein